MVGSAQRVVVACAWAPRDAVTQHCLEYLGSEHSDLEFEGSARSVVRLEGVVKEAAPYVAYAPVDLDGQVGIVVDIPPEVYELVRLVVHLVSCLCMAVDSGIPFASKHMISVLAYNTVRTNAALTITITAIILLSCSRDCATTPAS